MLHILQRHATTSTSGHGDPNLKRIQRILWPSWSFHFPHLRSELHGSFPQWAPATELPMGISIACVQEVSGILIQYLRGGVQYGPRQCPTSSFERPMSLWPMDWCWEPGSELRGSFPSPPTAQHGVENNTREIWKLSVFGNYLNFINFHQSSAHPQSPKPVKV